MAKPIKETPTLTGADARQFEEAITSVTPASENEKVEAQEAFDFFSSIATFSL